jgi:TolA-binding protein
MMRLKHFCPLVVLSCLPAGAFAQNDLLKPFRPGSERPATESKPAESKPPEGVPIKPFRAGEEPPKAQPVKPKPAAAETEEAPKAVPVKKPAEALAEPMAETKEEPPKAKPVPKPVQEESPEPGDIVVKSNVPPTSPEQVQLQFADGFYARKMWRDAAPEYESFLQRYPKAPPADVIGRRGR